MKPWNKTIMLLMFLLLSLGAWAQKTVVWDQPIIGYTKYNYFSIQKVELAKDRTSLYMSITFPSEAWFRFSPDTYIEADGKRYAIIGSDSIELGKEAYTSPQTMKKEFVLHFQPMPQKTKVFDMLESTQKNDFTFFYIHPNDYKMPKTAVPADFRADSPGDDALPETVFSEEPAVVHFKAMNYKKGMDAEIQTLYFDITNPNSYNEYYFNLDDEGCADFRCKVYYPTIVQFSMPSAEGISFAKAMVTPGKEVTILFDMLRGDKYPQSKVVGYKGYMAKLMNGGFEKQIRRCMRNRPYPSFPNSYEQYKTVDDLATLHDSLMLAFDKSIVKLQEIPEVLKRICQDWELQFFSALAEECPSLFNTQEFRDYVYRTRPRCFYGDYLKNDFGLKVFAPLFVNTKEQGLAPDRIRFIHSMSELNSGVFNPKPQLYDPLLSRLYDQKRQELSVKISQQKEGLATNVHYLELADVAPENTLQFLLDRYKGNVVMIDLWATWCGPCQLGHREMAPVKEELKDKNIVYLNLTSSTSPFEDWKRMVKDIPGEHYYVSNAQFDALHDLYKSEGGVPAYAIYNPKGELVLQQLGFSSVEPLKAGLLKALE